MRGYRVLSCYPVKGVGVASCGLFLKGFVVALIMFHSHRRWSRVDRKGYPVGINYGYMGKDNAQNTWCHLWDLKGFTAIVDLQRAAQ